MQLGHNVICHFRFICSGRWEDLTPIKGYTNKRFCDVCSSPVYLTSNYEELAININAKRCVAISLGKSHEQEQKFMGLVVPVRRSPYSPDSPDPILTRPVAELELTPGIFRKLQANNVQLIGDLVQCSPSQLSEQIGATNHQLNELMEVLASRDLSIGMHLEDWGLLSRNFR
jgi:DNA-directed RNA polymerase alpha subunit